MKVSQATLEDAEPLKDYGILSVPDTFGRGDQKAEAKRHGQNLEAIKEAIENETTDDNE